MELATGVGEGLLTAAGLFWKAAWALAFGYAVSAFIQVFVFPREAEQQLGRFGVMPLGKAMGLGFLSSSCSFAALSATRSLFAKGASLRNALAFMFASTNLVIELGFLLWIFLGWQFVLALYVGSVLLVGVMVLLARLAPERFVEGARAHARQAQGAMGDPSEGLPGSWRERIHDRRAWNRMGMRYVAEWRMIWKELLAGFTIAGFVAAHVPSSWFEAIFVQGLPGWAEPVVHAVVAPLVAVATVIGSMGNGPLAAILWDNGVAFAGIMAFLFADFIVPPALKINAEYYGWRFTAFLAAIFTAAAIVAAIAVQLLFELLGLIPQSSKDVQELAQFALDYTLFLNLAALAASGALVVGWRKSRRTQQMSETGA